jgi:C_GCAxxG_C_C family probable redox protein
MHPIDAQKIEKEAITLFNSGYNCAQSVLLSFAKLLKIDAKTAGYVASGFGAGMGRLQGTCGAVTGAYMVFGLYDGEKSSDNTGNIESTYLKIQQFNNSFSQINGTTECRLLINCNLNTNEGKAIFKEKNLKKRVCEKCIKDSINLTINQLSENIDTGT